LGGADRGERHITIPPARAACCVVNGNFNATTSSCRSHRHIPVLPDFHATDHPNIADPRY
jgi:hypothetical protein